MPVCIYSPTLALCHTHVKQDTLPDAEPFSMSVVKVVTRVFPVVLGPQVVPKFMGVRPVWIVKTDRGYD